LQEKRDELDGLSQHLQELEGEKEEVLRSKRSYEAEKNRAMGEIHRLRTKVASISSQMSQVKGWGWRTGRSY
jgi:chromosome segregation ATPase